MSQYIFVTACISADGDDINEMVDLPLNEEFETAQFLAGPAREAGITEALVDILGYQDQAAMAADWAISCHRSYYQGLPCLYVDHSRIEHVFVPQACVGDTLDHAGSHTRRDKLLWLEDLLDTDETWLAAKTEPEQVEALKQFVHAHEQEFRDHHVLLSSLFTHGNPYRDMVAQLDREILLSPGPEAPETDPDYDDYAMSP